MQVVLVGSCVLGIVSIQTFAFAILAIFVEQFYHI